MRSLTTIASMLLLSACGVANDYHIDPSFNEQVNKWNTLYPEYEVDITIKFQPLDGNVVGVCHSSPSRSFIEIDPEYWQSANAQVREELIFHELGHCMMDLGHNCEMTTIGGVTRPASIMHPWTFSYTEQESGYYYQQLPNSKTTCD